MKSIFLFLLIVEMKIIVAALLALACAFGAYQFAVQRTFVNPYPIVCDFVAQKIYLSEEKLKDWLKVCHSRSHLVSPYSAKKMILQDMNNVFELLKVSHLEIYDANEVKNIWKGESTETGLEGDFVESEFVVFKVHQGSPSEKAGFKKGDIVESINGGQPSPWTAASDIGLYRVRRGDKTLELKMKAGTFQRDDSPTFERRGSQLVIRVPSFRSEFFDDKGLKKISTNLLGAKIAVIDLRGNAGGNFVAGLRFLSILMCEPQEIGSLVKPKALDASEALLPDDLQDEHQLAVLERHHRVILKTYHKGECFRGALKVLVDGKSSSVAEMVTLALREFRHAVIAGAPTRGELLVGVWYPMDEVSPGVQISIPEAYYESAQGRRIEGQGVSVTKTLYYKLPQMRSGIDSWIEEILSL